MSVWLHAFVRDLWCRRNAKDMKKATIYVDEEEPLQGMSQRRDVIARISILISEHWSRAC